MSAAKLLLKIRRQAQSPYNTAILIILISFGLLNNAACEIAPKADDDPLPVPDKIMHTESIALNSINDMVGKVNPNGIGGGVVGLSNDESTKQTLLKSNLGFIHAFIASISVILVSELGDKTFFIAAIMAMRHPRLTVFAGAIGALALMTILSAVFGMAATVIPRVYTYYISTALFAIFGLKMLRDGYYMSPNGGQEELEEVQTDLRRREDELMKSVRKDRRKDDDDNVDDDDTRCDDKDIESLDSTPNNRRWKTTKNINDSDEDDSSNSPTRVMIPSGNNNINNNNNGSGSGIIINSTRRTQSTNNLKSEPLIGSSSATIILNSPQSLDEGIDVSQLSTISTAAIGNGDINAKGMELRRLERDSTTTAMVQDPESGVMRRIPRRSPYYLTLRILLQAFTMTFLAEWGDRSQLATIILAARENVYGVIVGGVLGHIVCTGLAVVGGRCIAQRISVRTVTIVGGVVFLLFAVSALFIDPDDE